MFNQMPLNNTFSIGKIVGGLSKTLNVANQLIPLYKEAKPMIQNAKSAFGLIKEFGNTTTNKVLTNKEKNITPIKEKIESLKDNNINQNKKGPTFFL